MGSITKKPKTPAVTYVNPTPTSISAPTVTDPVVSEPVKTDSEISTEIRTNGLLRRSRGRFGTIKTSFKGLFGDVLNDGEKKRKTLLGE